jgi:hypothetical protein
MTMSRYAKKPRSKKSEKPHELSNTFYTFTRVYMYHTYKVTITHYHAGIILDANCTQFRQRPISISNCFKNFTAFSTRQEKFFVYKTKTTDKGARNAGGASQHIEL